ncbi:MAG: response regulator transcription factor [Actinobacteria bacterium]|nr:response regulator transcription factor [Actinomycetota bacterium]
MDRTVVIVDDDPNVRQVLSVLLGQASFDIVGEAADGLEALTLVRDRRPALVILDQEMPRMKGDAAARLLRDLSPETKVLAFSNAFGSKPEWADAFVPKESVADVEIVLEDLLQLSLDAPTAES